MTREEATIIARHIAAGACAMQGSAHEYCRFMQEGQYDDEPIVQATVAALTLSNAHRESRLKEIRQQSAKIVELAA